MSMTHVLINCKEQNMARMMVSAEQSTLNGRRKLSVDLVWLNIT